MEKQCNRCGELKDIQDFSKATTCKDGYRMYCKACQKLKRDEWRKNHKEHHNEKCAMWVKQNPEKRKEINRKWRDSQSLETLREMRRNSVLKNRELYRVSTSLRRKRVRNATPEWANTFFLQEAYLLAQLRSKMFGFDWHVDHIIPLNGDEVCGLHVENNLQVIPALENLVKSNKF